MAAPAQRFWCSRILAKTSSLVGKRYVWSFEYASVPSMVTSKTPACPPLRSAVIPNSFLIAACRLEAWGR